MIGGKKTYEPDWRPAKRVKNRKALDAKRVPKCRICGKDGVSVHHLVERGKGGDDVPQNLLSLCGHGTSGCHGLVTANDRPTREKLRAVLASDEVAYIVAKKSRVWLDKNYPTAAPQTNKEKASSGFSEPLS